MTTAALRADVDATIRYWRAADDRVRPWAAWEALTGKYRGSATWGQVRTFMLEWLAAREQSSLQRAG